MTAPNGFGQETEIKSREGLGFFVGNILGPRHDRPAMVRLHGCTALSHLLALPPARMPSGAMPKRTVNAQSASADVRPEGGSSGSGVQAVSCIGSGCVPTHDTGGPASRPLFVSNGRWIAPSRRAVAGEAGDDQPRYLGMLPRWLRDAYHRAGQTTDSDRRPMRQSRDASAQSLRTAILA